MNGPCPVCASPICAYVRDVPTVRTRTEIPLYACLDCRSFWNESSYREDDAQLRRDVDWGVSVAERNRVASRELFERIEATGLDFGSVCEVGCGIGTTLEVAEDFGMRAVGFDTNRHAIDYGKSKGLDLRAEEWTARTDGAACDLYLCISVLEHLPQPRGLLAELCAAGAKAAAVYVSVPFLEPERWGYVLEPDPQRAGTPFFDNDVHVTHFSSAGLLKVLGEFGLPHALRVGAGPWGGVLATAHPVS